jgi:hypothetical protein
MSIPRDIDARYIYNCDFKYEYKCLYSQPNIWSFLSYEDWKEFSEGNVEILAEKYPNKIKELWTRLITCCYNISKEQINFFLDKGININHVMEDESQSPLEYARDIENNILVQLLIDNGAN